MPAVAGGWRKGMDRKAAAYLPLTADVVSEHLVGEVSRTRTSGRSCRPWTASARATRPEWARRAKRAVVGMDVVTMSWSDATRVHPPLPAVVHAELGAGLSLDSAQLTPAALSTLKHAASMANP